MLPLTIRPAHYIAFSGSILFDTGELSQKSFSDREAALSAAFLTISYVKNGQYPMVLPIIYGNFFNQILATPVRLAASATAWATAGPTLGSNAAGIM